MKKIFKNPILMLILGFIFSESIIYAVSIVANNVSYDNTKTNMKDSSNNNVTDIQKAIDVLYDKASNPEIPSNYKELNEVTTATSSDILSGKTAYDNNGQILTGSIGTYNGTLTVTPNSTTQTLATSGKYMGSNITVNAIPSSYQAEVNVYQNFLNNMSSNFAIKNFKVSSSTQTFNLGFQAKYISCVAHGSNNRLWQGYYNYYDDSANMQIASNTSTIIAGSLSSYFTINSSSVTWNFTQQSGNSWYNADVSCYFANPK